MPNGEDAISAARFEDAVGALLPELLDAYQPTVTPQPALPGGIAPDFLVEEASGRAFIVEAKAALPATQIRVDSIVNQLNSFADAYMSIKGTTRRPTLVLVVPGVLSAHSLERLRSANIHVIDGPALQQASIDQGVIDLLRTQGGGVRREPQDPGRELLRRLAHTQPGRADWSKYQTLVRDILAYTLCPPLEQPLTESPNLSGVNRRDIVLPNYSRSGFWHYMQSNYLAHYVVVDAKNYTGKVKKDSVLQLANYLSQHGAGLFGAIVTRSAGDRGAEVTRREQWVIGRKLIVILNDGDLEQMVQLKQPGGDPGLVVRQKIEDFRLSF